MKAMGCDAFEPGNRIDKAKALAFFNEHAEELKATGDNLSLKDQKLNEEIRKLKRSNDVAEAKLILKTELEREIREMANAAQGVLYSQIDSLAVSTAGQTAARNHALITAWVDEAVGKLSRGETK